MARVQYTDVVINNLGVPQKSVVVTVTPVPGTSATNKLWKEETGVAELASVITNSSGIFSVWLDEGIYDSKPEGSSTRRIGLINQVVEYKKVQNEGKPMLWGINSNTAAGHSTSWVPAGIVADRSNKLDVEYTATPESASTAVGESLANGCVPIVIINSPDNEVLSKLTPATYGKKLREIVQRVTTDHPTVTLFEVINEPVFKGPHLKSNASDYASLCKVSYEECITAGLLPKVKLLVYAWGTYEKVNSEGVGTGTFSDVTAGGGWISDMASSASGTYLKEHVNAWSAHPYGKASGPAKSESNSGFSTAFDRHAEVLAYGFNEIGANNCYITEIGFNIAGPGESGVATEALQASSLETALERAMGYHAEGWLQGLLVYDDSGPEGWSIYGKTAATVYKNFVAINGSAADATGWVRDYIHVARRGVRGVGTQPGEAGRKFSINTTYVPNTSDPTLVNLSVELEGGTERAEAEIRTSGEGQITFAELAATGTAHGAITIPISLFVSSGESWEVKGTKVKISLVHYKSL